MPHPKLNKAASLKKTSFPQEIAIPVQNNGKTLGSKIKELRTNRGLSQEELGTLATLSHSYISRLENDHYDDPGTYTLFKLSRALKVQFVELLRAAGYVKEGRAESAPRRTVEDIMCDLQSHMPITVPILASLDDDPAKAIDHSFWSRSKHAGKDLVGLVISKFSYEPEIREGDIVYIWRNCLPENGNLIICRKNGLTSIQRYHSKEHNKYGEIYGVIFTLTRLFP